MRIALIDDVAFMLLMVVKPDQTKSKSLRPIEGENTRRIGFAAPMKAHSINSLRGRFILYITRPKAHEANS